MIPKLRMPKNITGPIHGSAMFALIAQPKNYADKDILIEK